MKFANSYRLAVRALAKHKMQTALTILGMTIGVATVLTMISLGSGAEASIQDQVRSAGMNLILVQGGNWSRGNGSGNSSAIAYHPTALQHARLLTATWNPSQHSTFRLIQGEATDDTEGNMMTRKGRPGDSKEGRGAATTLTQDDVAAIRKVKGVQYASSGVHDTVALEANGKRVVSSLHGADTELTRIRRGWTYDFGHFFSHSEEKNGDNVVVLGQFVSRELFGMEDPVGKTLNLKGTDFKVIGVIGSGSWIVVPKAGDDQFDALYIPLPAMQRLMHQDFLTDAAVTTESTGDVLRVENSLKSLLRERHRISPNDPDDFTVIGEGHKTMEHAMRPDVASAVMGNAASLDKMTLDQLGKTLDNASTTMSALLISIATVSLIVGGIGVMNIMLLSVSQRTREIGIRRAIGARSQDVLAQFLLEATTLSLFGGLLGILIGCIVSLSIAHTVQWSTSVSFVAILVSFGVSAAIGIFFGYYPARQASQVLPIAALKYE